MEPSLQAGTDKADWVKIYVHYQHGTFTHERYLYGIIARIDGYEVNWNTSYEIDW